MEDAFRSPAVHIRIKWEDGGPVADPDPARIPILDHEPTVIIWRGDKTIKSIDKIWFNDDPGSEISPPGKGSGKVWVSVDQCTRTGDWKYSVTATSAGDEQGTQDPMIRNQ